MRNAQTSLRMETPPLWMWMCLLQMETSSLRLGGRALCGWKRRCADVRAGTQAPPLPFLVWLRVLRLPANSSPTDKIDEGCVAEGFDGGW